MKNIASLSLLLLLLCAPTIVSAQQALPYQPYIPQNNSGQNANGDWGATIATLSSSALMCALASETGQAALGKALGWVKNSIFKEGTKLTDFLTKNVLGEEQKVKDDVARQRLEALNRKEQCWDRVAKAMGNDAMKKLTNKTISWVNTGFDGNPLYIRDVNQYLNTVKKDQINKLLPQIGEDGIFSKPLRSILTKQIVNKNFKFAPTITTSSPGGVEFQSFQKDFTQGGWGAFLNSNNNPIGALLQANRVISTTVNKLENNTMAEINRNRGYVDVRKCVRVQKDKNGKDVCTQYATVTPGSLVADQIADVFGSPLRQLEVVDEINEIVDKFFRNITDKLFEKNKGLYNIGGDGGSYGGTGLGSNYGIDVSENFLSNAQSGVSDTDVSRPQMIRSILKDQKDFLSVLSDSIIKTRNMVPDLAQLDYCMPGPNSYALDSAGSAMGSLIGNVYFDFATRFDAGITPFPTIDPVTGREVVGTKNSHYIAWIDMPRISFTKSIFDRAAFPFIIRFNFSDSSSSKQSDRGLITEWITQGYNMLRQELDSTYGQQTVAVAFGNTGSEPYIDRAKALSAYRLTDSLIPFAQAAAQVEDEGLPQAAELEGYITELEGIHAEALAIVKVAKARYIKQMEDAGTPVNLSCINDSARGYVIDESPVPQRQRQESDATNPRLDNLNAAYNYFYSRI